MIKPVQSLVARLRIAFRNEFVRDVGVLVSGTGIAQALMVLVLPLLTRLYTPDDFSVFAVYASLLGIISTIACVRLEIAIPIPSEDGEAADLLALALAAAGAVALITGVAALVFGQPLVILLEQPRLQEYLWLLPIGVWLSGSYAALQYWATRSKRFSLIAKTRITQAVGGTSTQALLGWLEIAPLGLLLGHVVYRAAGIRRLASVAILGPQSAMKLVQPRRLLTTLRNYDRYPKFSTLEALANISAIELPILIIAAMAIGPEVGYLILATRVIAGPMSLIGSAVAQVYLSRAPEYARSRELGSFTADSIEGLFRVGTGPLVMIGVVAPIAFPLIFGEQWARAGIIASWMTPWFVMQFLTAPVSMVLHITSNQKLALALQVSGLILRVGSVVGAAHIQNAIVAEAYAVSGFVFYSAYLLVIAKVAGIAPVALLKRLSAASPPALIWLTAAAILDALWLAW